MGHLSEKQHRGVLTGAPITDMKITLLVGKAHLKHTEGGDMRQATYRAIRQGLMQAKSVLLEPWYDFTLTLPTPAVGRAITDIRAKGGDFESPESTGSISTLKGQVPAAELGDYADVVASYTHGQGRLQISPRVYDVCHNPEAVIAAAAYDPVADLENTGTGCPGEGRSGSGAKEALRSALQLRGLQKCYLVVVFDGWKVKGNPGEKLQHHNIQVVYTKEGETGDAYIEALVARIGSNYAVRVAISDALVQLRSLRSGVLRMSARELREELDTANREMGKHFSI